MIVPVPGAFDSPGGAARRVARNTLFLSVADVVGKAATFGFMLVAARRLGTEGFGSLSFALAYVSMFAVLTDLGIGQLAVREIARDHQLAPRLMGAALCVKTVATVGVITLLTLVAVGLGYSRSVVQLIFICGMTIADTAFNLFFRLVFQAFERTAFAAAGRVIQIGVLTAGLIALSVRPPTTHGYAWLLAISTLTVALYSWLATSTALARPIPVLQWSYWRSLLLRSLPFGLASVLIALYYWNGSTILARVGGDAEVGAFSAAFRLVLGLSFLASAFSGAMYPLMSRLYTNDRERLPVVLTRALNIIALAAVPIASLGIPLASPIIELLYGAQYRHSVPVLQVLAVWGMLTYFNCLLGHFFLSVDRARVVTGQAAVSLALNVVLNVLVIPKAGATGAAVALVVAEAAGLAVLIAVQLRTPERIDLRVAGQSLVRVIGAAALAGVLALVFSRWGLVAGLGVGVLAYAGLLLALGGLGRPDIDALRMVLRREGS